MLSIREVKPILEDPVILSTSRVSYGKILSNFWHARVTVPFQRSFYKQGSKDSGIIVCEFIMPLILTKGCLKTPNVIA